MIKAVDDKIVVSLMKRGKTKGGLILPETARDPQAYGKVLSVGEGVRNIEEGNILVFHQNAGMDILISNCIMKVVKYNEIYGILKDLEFANSLEPLKINSEGV